MTTTPSRVKPNDAIIVIALAIAALLVRLWGIDFGLPYEYHIDEHFYYPYAWAMGQGHFNLPDQSHGPSLYLGLLLISQQIARAMTHPEASPAQFGTLIETDPWPVLLSDRIVSAIAGALTIPVVYLIGRRFRDRRAGLIAAALMAVLFFHVRDSHFGVPDAVMTLFATSTVWLALRAHHTTKPIDFILAGFFAGLTAATKYTSAFVVVPVILATFRVTRHPRLPCTLLARPRRAAADRAKRRAVQVSLTLALAGSARVTRYSLLILGFLSGFVVGYPNLLLNFPAFIKDISFLWVRVGGGFEGWRLEPDSSALFYLFTLEWSTGIVMLSLSSLGLIALALRRTADDVILISFPIVYFIALSLSRGHFGRYMLPILPVLVVVTVDVCLNTVPDAIARIAPKSSRLEESRGSSRLRGHLPSLIGLVALLGILIPNTLNSLRLDWVLSQTDTRTVAKQWIESNIPAGARIAVEWPYHTPPLSNGYTAPPNSQREYWIDLVYGFGLADRPIAQYQTDGTQFIIATSTIRDIPTEDAQQEARRQQFYVQLPVVFHEIKRFSPRCDGSEPAFIFDQLYGPAIDLWNLCYAGPLITIYQVR